MNTKQIDTGARADGEAALLAQFGFSELPVMFAMREPGGTVIQEKEPCYQCMADGFYGRHRGGTWYEEGSIIVLDTVPNHQLQPLNRAAALKWAKWAGSLPQHKAAIDVGDMSEAAQMLAKNPDVLKLDPEKWQEAVVKLAVSLKVRREGGASPTLPGLAHNFAPQSGRSTTVPILGAKIAEGAQRGPGGVQQTLSAAEVTAGGARRAASPSATANPLGGANPPR